MADTLFVESVPALCLEGEFFAVSADEIAAVFGFGNVPDDIEVVHGDEFLVVVERTGEEEFVVFSAVEGARDDIEVHLLG